MSERNPLERLLALKPGETVAIKTGKPGHRMKRLCVPSEVAYWTRYEALRLKSGKIVVCQPFMRPGGAMSQEIMGGAVLLVRPGVYEACRNQGAERLSLWT